MRERRHIADSIRPQRSARSLGTEASRDRGAQWSIAADLRPSAAGDAVLVIATEPLRSALVDLARSKHLDVHACATPLDACQALVRIGARIAYAIISSAPLWGRELRHLLEEEHPEIKIIALIA